MKKNYLQPVGALLLSFLVFSGCQKEVKEMKTQPASADNTDTKESYTKDGWRLISLDWETTYKWQLHYNNKGLADKWVIDYGDGSPIEEAMFYDKENRLIKANELYYGSHYVYHFTYNCKRITEILRVGVEFPDQVQDFLLTYNNKGQNIRQDDSVNDAHVFMYYDALGNCTRTDIYFGTDLWFSDGYTFDKCATNPLLTISGIDIGFPFYGTAGFSNKRLFSSNLGVGYNNGTPFVYDDYDPSKTIIKNGNHDYPVSANYFDRVSAGPINISFKYGNSGGDCNWQGKGYSPSNYNSETNKRRGYAGPMLLRGSAESIKEQLKKLKE